MAEYKVVEIFESINGEGSRAGQLAVFVRLQGCNLNCSYCDTGWANDSSVSYTIMTEDEIAARIKDTGIYNVTLTGGEPLWHKDIQKLLERLAEEERLSVEIETNGSVSLDEVNTLSNRPLITMDYKLPGSEMEEKMCLDNFSKLRAGDTVKFVCKNKRDLEKSLEIINRYELTKVCHIYLSPVFGEIQPEVMVDFMKKNKMNYVNLQLQLHKFIWSPEKRGV